MLTDDQIAGMRNTIESALPDVGSITRRTDGVLDVDTGVLTVTAPAALWSGACRIRSRAAAARDVLVGDVHAQIGQYVITIPADADGFAVDDYFVATSCVWSTGLVGVAMQILDIQIGSWDLGRRLIVQTALKAPDA